MLSFCKAVDHMDLLLFLFNQNETILKQNVKKPVIEYGHSHTKNQRDFL